MSDCIDDELIQEAKFEILELIETTCELFISIEKDNCLYTQSSYDALFRLIHSIKGSLGMIGLEEEAHFVHLNEDVFRTFSIDLKYDVQKVSMMIDFYHALDEVIRSIQDKSCLDKFFNPKETAQTQEIDLNDRKHEKRTNTLYSIPTLRYQHLEHHEVVVLGFDPLLESILLKTKLKFDFFDSVENIYKKGYLLKHVQLIILNQDHDDTSREAIIKIFNDLYPHIHVVLIQNKPSIRLEDSSGLHFFQLGKNSKSFAMQIEKIFRTVLPIREIA